MQPSPRWPIIFSDNDTPEEAMPAATRRPLLRFSMVTLAVASLLAGAACAREPKVTFVPAGGTYTSAEARNRANTADPGAAATVRIEDATAERTAALVELRREGADGSAVADLLTEEFPSVTRSVPYYVEAATVDGTKAWIIAETWGGRQGTLDQRRLWVFDRSTHRVILSAVLR
jgi:hypothetical protein